MLSETIRKIKRESDFDEKARTAAELLAQTRAQSARIAPFARAAWNLDLLFLLLAILFVHFMLYFDAVKGILPTGLCQLMAPIFHASELTNEVKAWLYCLLGLVTVPAVFDVLLAAVCKRASKAAGETAAPAWIRTPEKLEDAPYDRRKELRRMEDTLEEVWKELNIVSLPVWIGQLLCALFMIPVAIPLCCIAVEEAVEEGGKIEVILACVILFLLILGAFQLLLRLQLSVLRLSFSGWKNIRQVKKLRAAFIQEAKKICPGYLTKEEEKAKDEVDRAIRAKRLAAERRSAGHTVSWYTEESSSSALTDRDHDDLDAVLDSLRDNYGSDWSDGV